MHYNVHYYCRIRMYCTYAIVSAPIMINGLSCHDLGTDSVRAGVPKDPSKMHQLTDTVGDTVRHCVLDSDRI